MSKNRQQLKNVGKPKKPVNHRYDTSGNVYIKSSPCESPLCTQHSQNKSKRTGGKVFCVDHEARLPASTLHLLYLVSDKVDPLILW